ncbi:MAG: hypothetical protein ACK5Q5_16885 [Planctomycetaceae bacterium]
MVRFSRRQFAKSLLAAAAGVSTSGCGYFLHPERRGQPTGELDWRVVALDALGLILFVVPGIIAFAVDFSSGAIYLPTGQGYSDAGGRRSDELDVVQVSPEELTNERISVVVSERAGQTVQLSDPACQRRPLARLADFWGAHDRLVAELNAVSSTPDVLRAQSR